MPDPTTRKTPPGPCAVVNSPVLTMVNKRSRNTAERPKLRARQSQAAITWLTFWGKEKLSTKDNLVQNLHQFEHRFVVDTHIPFLTLSATPENARTAFIVGTTVDKEISSLKALVEDRHRTPRMRDNVFAFGYCHPGPDDIAAGTVTPYLVLAKLDGHLNSELDMNALRAFSALPADKRPWDTTLSIKEEKDKILRLLGISEIGELSTIPDPTAKDEELRAFIIRERQNCPSDFWKSNDVVRHGYARMLLSKEETQKEFNDPAYPNVFGDAHLIQNALFLNAAVMSNDEGVHTLAHLCGVQCRRWSPNHSPSPVPAPEPTPGL